MTPRSRTLLGSAAILLAVGTVSAQAQTMAAPPATTAPGMTATPPAAAKSTTTTPADKMAAPATTGMAKTPMHHKSTTAMHSKTMHGKMSTSEGSAAAQDPQVAALNERSLMDAQKGTNYTPGAGTPTMPSTMPMKSAPAMKGKSSM